MLELPNKKYQIIYADPPWLYEFSSTDSRKIENQYDTMSIDDIKNISIHTDDNCALFLWATSPKLVEALEVMKSWGFKYKTSFVWDKIKHNMGHYNSVRHEFLLVCTKGSCTPDNIKLFDSVVSIERAEHSKKPEVFREIIDTIYTFGNRIELFARDKYKNWDAWGNDAKITS